MQVKTQLKCCLIQPGEDPSTLDVALLHGCLRLRQLRPNAPLTISQVRSTDNEGHVLEGLGRESLDSGAESMHGISLLRDFCSEPLPRFRAVQTEGGFVHGELVGNGAGNRGAITCIDGSIARSVVSRYRDEHNWAFQVGVDIHRPCEVQVLDLLVRAGTYEHGMVKPQITVFGMHSGGPPYPTHGQERDLLPTSESVVYWGKGSSVPDTPDIPRNPEMVQYVFDQLKWDGEQFDVYRCRMAYPMMPATVVMRFDLPHPPQS